MKAMQTAGNCIQMYSGRLLDLMVNEMPQAFILKKAIVSLGMKITLQGTIAYPTKREKEHHLHNPIFGGYVSSLEGTE